MQQVIAALTRDTEGTLEAMRQVHDELAETNRLLQARIDQGESIPLDEALDMEQTATLAAASNLLSEAHASPDAVLFGEAQMRAETIASTLDQIHEAYRDGDPQRMNSLRDDVGIALESFADFVRSEG
jgi:hypothetical protein